MCSDGEFERNSLGRFVAANKLPIIVTFSRESTARIFQAGITKQVTLHAFLKLEVSNFCRERLILELDR